MNHPNAPAGKPENRLASWGLMLAVCIGTALMAPQVWAAGPGTLTINVQDVDPGSTPPGGFYYTVQEDNTYWVTPGIRNDPHSPEVSIAPSHAPVVAAGVGAGTSTSVIVPDTAKRYFVSAVPWGGSGPVGGGAPADAVPNYTIGGAAVAAAQSSVTVKVHSTPTPTAQIFILAFEDNASINAAPDQPAEPGLPGFTVHLFDTSGGRLSQDAFGNPLGTTYQQNPDGTFVFDVDGSPMVDTLGTGVVSTDANGEAIIRFLFPGKYGIQITPPTTGPYSDMVQTSTIEGTPGIDNWVMGGEPPYMREFGTTSWHTFIGFVHPMLAPGGPGTITGRYTAVHETAPPYQNTIVSGPAVPHGWVGLSDLGRTNEQAIYAQPTNPDGTFTISGVPPGNYLLTVWDTPDLNYIIDYRNVTVPPAGGTIDLGDVAAFAWFGHLDGSVFYDANQNGIRDVGEQGLGRVVVNLRAPEGNIITPNITSPDGSYSFDQVFPFFHWIIAEVDNARWKPTGATIVCDAGGGPLPDPGYLQVPQVQPGGATSRTETGPGKGLTEGMLLYADQTHTIDWGKGNYSAAEGGTIYGIVSYDTTRAENDPRYGTQETWQPGIPHVTINLYPGDSSGNITGPVLMTTTTSSWDDNLPTGCVNTYRYLPNGALIMDCAETLRNWNQTRPAVYDGVYRFTGVPPGYYVVEMVPPPGYQIPKEEDRNVFSGQAPTPNVVQAACVGPLHTVPYYLELFPGEQLLNYLYGTDTDPLIQKPLCNRKLAVVGRGQNFNADFFLFVPGTVAGRVWGICLNDTTLEFNTASPQYGNNLGVAFIPISIKDYAGTEIERIYTDEYGRYNALVPSTYTINPPDPTGVAPNIVQFCINDPGPIPDPANPGQFITDPWYNPSYTQNCTELDIWPGTTLTADTPHLPIAAMVANTSPLDCEAPDHTPYIRQVNGTGTGPYLQALPASITITAVGNMTVANPAYDPNVPGSLPTIVRDYGFGTTKGKVLLSGVAIPDANVTWSAGSISATIPSGRSTGELLVTRGDNSFVSPLGITLHIGDTNVLRVPGNFSTIQAALDNSAPGGLVLVGPGIFKENLIMWKQVQLQGAGPFVTQIQAGPMSTAESAAWTTKMTGLEASGVIDLVPGERADFYLEVGAGVTIVAKSGAFSNVRPAMVDGFDIEGAVLGGGIFVNAYARYTHLSNNRLRSNQGNFGGGIRVGTPMIICVPDAGPPVHTCPNQFESSHNEDMLIQYNQVFQNGAIDGGGGAAIFEGADRYQFLNNVVCGNFSLQYGGGMAHQGLSPNGQVIQNVFLNNQAFDEGGGFMAVGETVPAANVPLGFLSDGCGSITIDKNLFQGNFGGDDGGAIRLMAVNGEDVRLRPTNPAQWYTTLITNNMLINNVSGDIGGGIALLDAVRTYIVNDTITHNDSTATSPDSFGGPCVPAQPPGQVCPEPAVGGGGLTSSIPQAAGIGAQLSSSGLQAAMATSPVPAASKLFSNPVLEDDIIWQNRSWWWDSTGGPGGFGALMPRSAIPGAGSDYWDMAVYTPGVNYLTPRYSVLTSLNRGDGTFFDGTNTASNPLLTSSYFNTYLATSKGAALGNFVTIAFDPLGLNIPNGNAHIQAGSSAFGRGNGTYVSTFAVLTRDYDLQTRPTLGRYDSGADQISAAPPASADLNVSMTGSPASIPRFVISTVTYTAVVSNLGPDLAASVVLSDTLPLGASSITATTTQGSTSISGRTVTANLGNVAAGGSVTVTITMRIRAITTLTNTATVSSSTTDPISTNNSSIVKTNII